MQHKNIKSSYALKWTALLVAGIFAHPSAFALGLGDIQVKSHLGQPLKAQIKVYGAADIKGDAACFSLNADGVTGTHLNLKPLGADEALLTITSVHAIDEPIVNLSVAAMCESEVRRDYVLLLDPVISNEIEDVAEAEAMPVVNVDNGQKVAPKKARKQPQAVKADTAQSIKKSFKNKVLNRSEQALSGSNMPRPRLNVSGGITDAGNRQFTQLRMDKQLVMRPNATDPIPAGDAEMMDELTAMNNRLKHMQTQIAQLQQNNLKLAEENAIKTKTLDSNQTELTQFKQFGFGLGALLLLLSGHLAIDWWRRRKAHMSVLDRMMTEKQDEIGLKDDLFATDEMRQTADTNAENSATDAPNFGISLEAETLPIVVEEGDEEMSVLEHADIFLSHGRTELAIQILQNHLLENPKQSVTIWLFLLDLLAKQNLHALYEQTALDCKDHFNINIPHFDTKPSVPDHSLEAYPRLCAGLQSVWGTPAALTFLDDLIYNNRLEPRVGFDKQLIEELLMLKSVAQERASLAEVIQLDQKKVALKERKEAQLAAKKAERQQELDDAAKASEETKKTEQAKENETKFDFEFIEWNA